MENITVIAALRKSRIVAGKAPVIIRVIIGRQIIKTLNTGIKVPPASWDEKARLVKRGEDNSQIYNMKLKSEVTKIESQLMIQSLQGVALTKTKAKRIVEGKAPGRDFFQFCTDWIDKKYTNKETIRAYKGELTKMKKYRSEVSFGDIDVEFLMSYKKYMNEKLGNSPNTLWKTFKFINTMVRDALKIRGIIDHNPFEDFNRGRYKQPKKLALSIEDCKKIEALLENDSVEIVTRRVATKFLLMCYSGLRFSDAMAFDPTIHVIGNDRIHMKTQKAGVVLNMKLHSRLSKIIAMESTFPLTSMSNHRFNQILKLIAMMADIKNVNLTCHVGRHTFGGLLAEMEIPEEQAKLLLAHKDINSTRIYYHVNDKQLDDAMDKFNKL